MAKLLTLDDRLKIEKRLESGLSIHRISQELDFADSTIRDEVKHNSHDGRYVGEVAHRKSCERRRLPKRLWKASRQENSIGISSIKKRMMSIKKQACSYCHVTGQKTIQSAANPKLPVYITCIVCKGEGVIEAH